MSRKPQFLNTFLDFASAAFSWMCALLFVTLSALLMYSIFRTGLSQVDWAFITEAPSNAGLSGGIAPIIVSTLLIVLVCICTTVPFGLGTAIYLTEYLPSNSRVGAWVRTLLDTLAATPSIVFGLFGNAFFCVALGMELSILSGGLTLACMVLPIFIRVAEAGIREVSDDHRRGAMALSLSKTTTTFQIVLPRAMPSLIAAFSLGLARALAETAALIFTSGEAMRYPESLLDSGRSLSIHIYSLSTYGQTGLERGFATATVLVALLLIINSLTYLGLKFVSSK